MPYAEQSRAVTPHNLEAEESVIGGVLVHQRKLSDVLAVVRPDDFYHPALRAIYEAMISLDGDSKPVDSLTVVEQMRALETFDKLRAFKGAEYLLDLMQKVVTVENIGYHARIVRSKARRRRMFDSYRELAAAACQDSDDDEYFAEAERQMLAIGSEPDDDELRPRTFTEVMHEYVELLEQRYKLRNETGQGIITGVATGYGELDRALCGLQETDLVLVAGRPSMGKSSFAMNVAVTASLVETPTLVFSLEMNRQQLAERALSGEAKVDSQRLRHGDLEAKHWVRLVQAAGRLADHPLKVLDRGSVTLAQIRSVARAWRMQHPVDDKGKRGKALVILDYLQLVSVGKEERGRRNRSREQEVSEISCGLKQLAKDLRCPVVALSQLNRSLESRPDKRPMLSDLRDSGSLEQDADVVMFVYRDEVYSKEECRPEDKGVAEIIVRKQRMGPLATVRLTFLDAFTRFENMSRRDGA
jgi:replicative DNA helicase